MNKFVHLLLVFFLGAGVLPFFGGKTAFSRQIDDMRSLTGDAPYLLYDANSGKIIAHNRAFERWHPASLTKLMTAYVAFVAIARGEIAPGSPVVISKASRNAPPSRMGYPVGAKLRLDRAITILLVKSANDVALALGEAVAGSQSGFVDRMNIEARRLGLRDTHFTNPNGLHHSRQYSSARDMAILTQAIWREFSQFRNLYAIPAIRAGGKAHYSYNLLLERFDGAIGMKTGFVCASGYNIVAAAKRGNRHLVAILLGTNSQTARAVGAARLLEAGFDLASGNHSENLVNFVRQGKPVGPVNLRRKMCSKKAREARYDPTPDTAVIKSKWLKPRRVTAKPVNIRLGDIDAEPGQAWLTRKLRPARAKVPIPVRRPDYRLVNVDGKAIASRYIGKMTVPLPTKKPDHAKR